MFGLIMFLTISVTILYFVVFGPIAWFSERMLPDLSGKAKVRERPKTTRKRDLEWIWY